MQEWGYAISRWYDSVDEEHGQEQQAIDRASTLDTRYRAYIVHVRPEASICTLAIYYRDTLIKIPKIRQ